jgi:photosystem II stability/assembly factor-like uncharacterized protein
LRGAAASEQVRALIDGAAAETFFAAHSVFIGLDQINVIVPRTLLGRGYHRLKVSVGERMSNEMEFELALPGGSTPLPTATFDSIVLDEDTKRVIKLSGSDAEGRPLFFTVTGQPQHGQLLGNGTDREYQPTANYNGADSLTFKVNNGLADSATATVTLLIRPVNDPPTLTFQGPASSFAGEQLIVNMSGSDIDGNQNLVCEAVELPEGATFTQSSATSWQVQWVPPFLRAGANEFKFRLRDDGAPPQTSLQSFTTTVNVRPIPRTPVSGTFGGEGGDVRAIHFGPDYLLINAGNALYRSTNDGRYWRLVYRADTTVTAIAAVGDAVIAAAGRVLLRSTTNGVRWTVLPAFPGQTINALVVNGGMLFAAANDSVYRSADGGETWLKVDKGLVANRTYLTLAVTGTTLLAGNASATIYRSADNGANWTSISQGLTNAGRVQSLGQNAEALFAGTSAGVYRTTNNGQNWTKVYPATASLNCFSVLASGMRIYAATNEGTFVSTDNGETWNPIGQSPVRYNVLAERGGSLYAGDVRGLFVSSDQGQTFESTFDGIFSGSVERVTSVFVDGNTVYAANSVDRKLPNAMQGPNVYGRIYRSIDRGRNWEIIHEGNHRNGVFITKLGEALFMANAPGLMRLTTVNGRDNWQKIGPQSTLGPDPGVITSMAYDSQRVCIGIHQKIECYDQEGRLIFSYLLPDPPARSDPGLGFRNVCQLTLNGEQVLFGYCTTFESADIVGLYRLNSDGGITRADSGLPGESIVGGLPLISQVIASRGKLFASGGTFSSPYVAVSVDNGETWRLAPEQIYVPIVLGTNLLGTRNITDTKNLQVALSRDNGDTWTTIMLGASTVDDRTNPVFGILGTNQIINGQGTGERGITLITDFTQSWSDRNTGLGNMFLNTIATNSDTLLAGTLGSGLFSSTDGGQNWISIKDGFPANANIQSIAVSGTTQFAALFGDGVYRSTGNGVSWSAANNGLTNLFVNAVKTVGSTIFALTERGVFRSSNNGTNWVSANSGLPQGSMTSLVAIGSSIFVGTELGIYRSINNGQNWTASTTGLTRRIQSLGLGADGQTLFAGTANAGVFRSTDGGQTWVAVNNQLPTKNLITSFVVARGRLYMGTINGVFVTTDNGASWEQIKTGMEDIFVTGLTAIGDRLFAAFATSGIFLSEIPR